MNYAIDKGARISSNSWGGQWVDGFDDVWGPVLRNNPEHLFVAAAGNDNQFINDTNKAIPCGVQEPNMLCVASSTQSDTKSRFSNYGKNYVHVFAPGSSILSTMINNNYVFLSGTSMACPHVSGLAALMMTMREDMSASSIRDTIEANVQSKNAYKDLVSSGGLIDVAASINIIGIVYS